MTPYATIVVASPSRLDFAFAELKERWGGADGYLSREIGLTRADIAQLRARYTL